MRALSRDDMDYPSLGSPDMSSKEIADPQVGFPRAQPMQINLTYRNLADEKLTSAHLRGSPYVDFTDLLPALAQLWLLPLDADQSTCSN